MSILDDTKITFKFIEYGQSTSGLNEDDSDFNNFEVEISYNGNSIKIPYSVGTVNLKGLMNEVLENMFKIDIIGRIIIDSYPFETINELKECLIKKGYSETEDYYQNLFNDIHAQSKKFRTLFTENDLKELKIELQGWLDSHPEEAKTYGNLEIKT